MHVEQQAQVRVVELQDRPGTQQAGVRYQAVQLAVAPQGGIEQGARGIGTGDVADDRVHAAGQVPGGVGDLFEGRLVDVVGDHGGALPAQLEGVGAAEPARRAGHDDGPPGQRHRTAGLRAAGLGEPA